MKKVELFFIGILLLIAMVALSFGITPVSAYQVWQHTGHGPDSINQLWDTNNFIDYLTQRRTTDGIWTFRPTFNTIQNGLVSEVNKTALVSNIGSERETVYEFTPYIVEGVEADYFTDGLALPYASSFWSYGLTNPVYLMFYREPRGGPGGNYIRAEDIARLETCISAVSDVSLRSKMQAAGWITHSRQWNVDVQASVDLPEVKGLVLEFGVNQTDTYIDNVITPAVIYAIDQEKKAFLLMPPGLIEGAEYYGAFQNIVTRIRNNIGIARFESDQLVFVAANYNYGEGTFVPVSPETQDMGGGLMGDAYSVSGINRWLTRTRTIEVTPPSAPQWLSVN